MPWYLITGILALAAVGSNVWHELQQHSGSTFVTAINLMALAGLCLAAWRAVAERGAYRRKRAMALQRARESDSAMQNLIEQFPCAVAFIDTSLSVRRVNGAVAALTGFPADEVVGRKCFTVFGTGMVCDGCPVVRAIETKQVQQHVKRELDAAGQEIYVEQTAIPILDRDGEVRHTLEIVFDVTRKTLLERENQDMFIQTVGALASLIDRRDTATGLHSVRVREIALRVGRRMGLSEEVLEEISVAALLHDIGKIGVPENILNKPGKLSEEEFAIIREHPATGYNTVGTVKSLARIAEYILSHHERFDGTGYPDGKSGEDIPLVARILCVADVYEAITADRIYRPAMECRRAVEVMRAERGRMFDPQVLDAFFAELRARGGAIGQLEDENIGQ